MEFRFVEISPPICPHGPTVLFEPNNDEEDSSGEDNGNDNNSNNKRMKGHDRKGKGGHHGGDRGEGTSDGRRKRKFADRSPYFACSAYRCQKECNFKMLRDRWVKMDEVQRAYSDLSRAPPKTGSLINYIFDDENPDKEYGFCFECCRVLILLQDNPGSGLNKEHIFGTHIMKRCKNVRGQLKRSFFEQPTNLLTPKKSNRGQSQYFFADPVRKFIVDDIIVKQGFKHVLCIGCPTIFEMINNTKQGEVDAFLLDIDYRFAQFIHPQQFTRFNMFNYFFFDDQAGENSVREFLSKGTMEDTLILCDPPFGVRLVMLKKTIRRFQAMINGWSDISIDDDTSPYPAFCLCFPYFNEHWIKSVFGDHLKRTDFVMFYANHSKFKIKTGSPNGVQLSSPVRMFTNLDRSRIDLSSLNRYINADDPFYSYCNICKRSIFKSNKHCKKCNDCSARESNKSYRHCNVCGTCYKSSWSHCDKCRRCHLFMNCPKGTRSPLVDNHVVQNVSMLVNDSALYLLTQSQIRALQNGDKFELDFKGPDDDSQQDGEHLDGEHLHQQHHDGDEVVEHNGDDHQTQEHC